MKVHRLLALGLGLAASATAASAQDATLLQVKSNVTPYCTTMTPTAPAPLNVGALTDANGLLVATFGGTTTRDLGAYYCNAPATVTLAASPLMQTAGTPVAYPDSFTNRIDYIANLTWDDLSLPASSASPSPATHVGTEANTGNLIISVSDPDISGTQRPIAGDYAGTVTLTVVLN
ncbi:MAG: hypothetical protein IT546_07980 [Caulobacteraceae bacterium]|nr:hypothetical protein [Caulobacteraceae bacterium]